VPTFLFTDIAGSTLHWERNPEDMAAALARHDEILSRLIAEHGGRVVKHTGDGVFAVFGEDGADSSPLECAIGILSALGEEDWGALGTLEVRVAINSGDAEKRGSDYFGSEVNRTARLLDAGWGGQILLTHNAAEGKELPDGARLSDLGEHMLKDLSESRRIYSLLHAALPVREFPALRSLNSHSHNLPPQSTDFIGRGLELAAIDELLSSPSCRLLTLLGPGGIGKTRIALQVAAEHIEEYPDGVFFVALAPLTSPDNLVQTIAGALGTGFYSKEDLQVQLINFLRDKKMLLVMDNFEHLIPGAELLADILTAAAGIRFLVTSRQRLNLRDEWLYEIEGMEYSTGVEEDGTSHDSAIRLFERNTHRLVPEFELNGENIPLVTEICRLVGGMPLAIELAASWMRLLSLSEIITEMREGLDFLETTLVDVPGRHRSLGHVFEYSWKLLSKQEKAVLAGLSCFRGGFDRKGAKAVAGADLQLIGSLVDKSLLHRISTDRFGVHEVTRQYAEAKLREDREQYSCVRELHCLYYIDCLEEKEVLLKTYERKQAIDEMYVDIENIRSAWDWAVEHRRYTDIARSTRSLIVLHNSLGWFRSGEQLFTHTIDSLGEVPESADQAIADLLLNRGWLRVLIGRRKEAVEDFEQCLILFRRIGDKSGEAAALCRLSTTELFAGCFDKATELAVESIECVESTGDLFIKAMALNDYGNVERRMGNYTHAAEIYAEALAVLEEEGDTYGEIICLGNLGIVNYRLGNLEIAKKITEESVALAEKFGEKRMIALRHSDLANVLRAMGEMEQARKILLLCIEQNRELGLRSATGINIGNLAFLERTDGNFDKAAELYSEMNGIAAELGRPMMLIESLCGQADIAMLRGDVDKAFEYYYMALEHATGMPVVRSILHILIGLAEVFMNTGKLDISLDLLAFSMENSGNSESIQRTIMELVTRLGIDPSSDDFTDACEGARTTAFEQIMEELLKERPL